MILQRACFDVKGGGGWDAVDRDRGTVCRERIAR